MASYLGSGDGEGEGSPLSRRGSSAGAPGPSLPRRPGALLGPRPEASRPGRPSSAPRRCPRGPGRLELPGRPAAGGLSRGAPGSPHPLPLPGRPRSRGRAGKASRGERAGANAGSGTQAAPFPQRRRRPGPCCCCQLVEGTLSMRARRPHPGNFRVWPFFPRSFPFSRLPPPPAPSDGRVALRRRPRGSTSRLAAGSPDPGSGRAERAAARWCGEGLLGGSGPERNWHPSAKKYPSVAGEFAYSGHPVSVYK